MKKLSKLDFSDFYYCAEQKFLSLLTSLFENPVCSVMSKSKKTENCLPNKKNNEFYLEKRLPNKKNNENLYMT